ncbi:hypothetical protein T492DRAFT_859050 [Pavlovales sp. CCMP2436]|nr:hypothetical protein T492DRAFT_859050 [Pavlovales sp. CCMP2436]
MAELRNGFARRTRGDEIERRARGEVWPRAHQADGKEDQHLGSGISTGVAAVVPACVRDDAAATGLVVPPTGPELAVTTGVAAVAAIVASAANPAAEESVAWAAVSGRRQPQRLRGNDYGGDGDSGKDMGVIDNSTM